MMEWKKFSSQPLFARKIIQIENKILAPPVCVFVFAEDKTIFCHF
jgi:hypothetical protein